MFLQLWHLGRISHPLFLDGALPVAPSAIAPEGNVSLVTPKQPYVAPRALAREEIPEVIAAFTRGAQNAQRAGFDGVEIHGANGYLLDQFLQDRANRRTDDDGGSVENRARLLLEVTDAAIAIWGPDGSARTSRRGVTRIPWGIRIVPRHSDMWRVSSPGVALHFCSRASTRKASGSAHS